MRPPPLQRLAARIERTGAPLCVGIDPVAERLPAGLPRNAAGIAEWGSVSSKRSLRMPPPSS